MASINAIGPKNDRRYRARWRTPDGRSRSKTFVRKVDAQRHLTAMEHTNLTGSYADPAAGEVTFKAFAERWRAMQVHRPGTSTSVEQQLRLHVYPYIGDRRIGSILPGEIQAMVRDPPRPSALLRQRVDPFGCLRQGRPDRLGHASAKTTLDIYGHLFADEEDRTRASIDNTFGAVLAVAVSDSCHESVATT